MERKMQDFSSFVHYYDEVEWSTLGDRNALESSKERIIMKKVILCGGRCLREPTLKLMLSFLLSLCGQQDMAPSVRLSHCGAFWTQSSKIGAPQLMGCSHSTSWGAKRAKVHTCCYTYKWRGRQFGGPA